MIDCLFKMAYSQIDPEGLLHPALNDPDFRKAVLDKYIQEIKNIYAAEPEMSLLEYRSLPQKTRSYIEKLLPIKTPIAVDLDELYTLMGEKPLNLGKRHSTIYLPQSRGNYIPLLSRVPGTEETLVDKAIVPYHELTEIREGARIPNARTLFINPEHMGASGIPITELHANINVLRDEAKAYEDLRNLYERIYGTKATVPPPRQSVLSSAAKDFAYLRNPELMEKARRMLGTEVGSKASPYSTKYFLPKYRRDITREYSLLGKNVPVPGKDELMAINVLTGGHETAKLPGSLREISGDPAKLKKYQTSIADMIRRFAKKNKIPGMLTALKHMRI